MARAGNSYQSQTGRSPIWIDQDSLRSARHRIAPTATIGIPPALHIQHERRKGYRSDRWWGAVMFHRAIRALRDWFDEAERTSNPDGKTRIEVDRELEDSFDELDRTVLEFERPSLDDRLSAVSLRLAADVRPKDDS